MSVGVLGDLTLLSKRQPARIARAAFECMVPELVGLSLAHCHDDRSRYAQQLTEWTTTSVSLALYRGPDTVVKPVIRPYDRCHTPVLKKIPQSVS